LIVPKGITLLDLLLTPPRRLSLLKKLVVLVLLAWLQPGKSVWAGPNFDLGVESFVATGNTSYDTTFSRISPTYGNYNGESKLDYNLNADMLGLNFGVSLDHFPLTFGVEYAFSVLGDGQILTDRDWVYDPAYNPAYGTLAGDTLSTGVNTPAQFFKLTLRIPLASLGTGSNTQLGAEAGFESRHWGVFDVYNYSGNYYRFFTGAGQSSVNVVSPAPVLSYEITTHSYFAGLNLKAYLFKGIQGEFGARVGLADFSDLDDHFLKQVIATATGSGFAWDCNSRLAWDLCGGWTLFVHVEAMDLSASGTQTQTSQVLPFSQEINDQVETFQLSFGLGISFLFNP
jgi:hypothetical protein